MLLPVLAERPIMQVPLIVRELMNEGRPDFQLGPSRIQEL